MKHVAELIERLDAATARPDIEAVCRGVKDALIEAVTDKDLQIPEDLLQTSPDGYARRLLHKGDRYAAVVMVWGAGQGTPIHDHDGQWCVECVYSGNIRVVSYDLVSEGASDGTVGFVEKEQVLAGRGEAGALIPPFDYHVIENPRERPAITIHVYGGELHGCEVFLPDSRGRYRRERRALTYTA